MKIKTLTTLLFMVSIYNLYAQNNLTIDLDIKTVPTENSTLNETGFGLRFFKNIDTKNKITNTFKYRNINVNYDSQNNSNQFTSIENAFELSHQLTEKTKLKFEVTPSINFESSLDLEELSILGGIAINHTLSTNSNFTIGIKRASIFGKLGIIPTLSFYHQISRTAFIEIGFPDSKISYSNNIRNAFSLTNSFNGSSYNLDEPKVITDLNTATKAGFSQITTALEYERNLDSNWFFNLKCGYDFNKNYTLKDNNGNTKYDFNIKDGYIFNIGIKYKH